MALEGAAPLPAADEETRGADRRSLPFLHTRRVKRALLGLFEVAVRKVRTRLRNSPYGVNDYLGTLTRPVTDVDSFGEIQPKAVTRPRSAAAEPAGKCRTCGMSSH